MWVVNSCWLHQLAVYFSFFFYTQVSHLPRRVQEWVAVTNLLLINATSCWLQAHSCPRNYSLQQKIAPSSASQPHCSHTLDPKTDMCPRIMSRRWRTSSCPFVGSWGEQMLFTDNSVLRSCVTPFTCPSPPSSHCLCRSSHKILVRTRALVVQRP